MDIQQYFTTATITELCDDPFLWLAVVLAVVAPPIAMTRRKHVGRNRSNTVRAIERNKVIHRQGMPQPGRATAIGATATPPIECKLPIRFFEVISQFGFARKIAAHDKTQLVAIVLPIFTHPLAVLIGILEPPYSYFLPVVWVGPLIVALTFTLGIQVARSPISIGLAALLSILGGVLMLPFAALVWIAISPISNLFTRTDFAFRTQRMRATALFGKEIFSCRREFLPAFRAAFEGYGIMGLHRNSSFLVPNPGTLARRGPVFSFGFYSCNYAIEEGF